MSIDTPKGPRSGSVTAIVELHECSRLTKMNPSSLLELLILVDEEGLVGMGADLPQRPIMIKPAKRCRRMRSPLRWNETSYRDVTSASSASRSSPLFLEFCDSFSARALKSSNPSPAYISKASIFRV